jgi:hypothetical protein
MAKKSYGKRPCSICHKWFQPDVRQKKRQKTCGRSKCQKELHRRNCRNWNKRNKEDFANSYLEKKLEQVEPKIVTENNTEPPTDPIHSEVVKILLPTSPFVLPVEIITKEYGARNLVIIHYLVKKIISQCQWQNRGFP